MSANFFELVRAACPSPEKNFLQAGRGRTFTCGEMLAWTGRLANILVLSGVEPGDRVAVQAEKTAEHLLFWLAILRAGAVYVPVATGGSLAELGQAIDAVEAKLVVCDPAKREAVAPVAEKHGVAAVETLDAQGGGLLMQGAAKAPSDFADVPREDDDLAILHVSGAGERRAAMLTHRDLALRARPLIAESRFMELLSIESMQSLG